MERKRINIRVPLALYNRFIERFPFRGELTGFIVRCMEFVVDNKKNPHQRDMKEIENSIKEERT